jgi:hypothetical protein
VVEARLEDGLVELAHHLVGVGVGRRIGQRHVGDAVAGLVLDEGLLLGLLGGGGSGGGVGHRFSFL